MSKGRATKDILQILRGMTIIGEQLLKGSRPEAQYKVNRAVFHATELINSIKELSADFSNIDGTHNLSLVIS